MKPSKVWVGRVKTPFFSPEHQDLACGLAAWVPQQQVDERDDRSACKTWVKSLGEAGWLRCCVPAEFGYKN